MFRVTVEAILVPPPPEVRDGEDANAGEVKPSDIVAMFVLVRVRDELLGELVSVIECFARAVVAARVGQREVLER